jgi:NAD(P)-dependent dehydrogenase (short-subunit alcohol dehydrogenase family)
MANEDLNQQRVLIIGGGSGIGLAVAKLVQDAGAHTIIASRTAPERERTLCEQLDARLLHTCMLDITSDASCAQLFQAIGSIDHLVMAVRPGIKPAPFPVTNIDEAKQAFDTKFWGAYRLIQQARDNIRDDGSIILTSGIAGERIYPQASTMALINSATETLCRTLAVELAFLRVNAVSPGFVAPKPEPVREAATRFPAKRLASVDEVASAYLWLMQNRYVTGSVIVVDGGARLM